jgi:hypothetical protein
MGRLGLTSPSSRSLFPTLGTMLGYDCQLSFSMPYALARSPIPCSSSFSCPVSGSPARRVLSSAEAKCFPAGGTPSTFVHKETLGSPKSPGYPLELMLRSSTPVVSHSLALSRSGLLPSTSLTVSAFPSVKFSDAYPMSTIIQISRLNHAAYILVSPGIGLPLPDLPAGFTTGLLAKL